jgi:tRNA(adenine34) deaminase
MREALKEAKIALKEGSWPIGCVIVLDNKIIARAPSSVIAKRNRLAHAEMLALAKAQKYLFDLKSRVTVYTTYEPCPMCLGAIVIMRAKRVVSGINVDGSGGMELLKSMPRQYNDNKHKIEHTKGVLAKECFELFMKSPLVQEMIEKGRIKVVKPNFNKL